MNVLKTCPKVLFRKILLTALVGAGCLVVGAAYYLFSKDMITLVLSCLVLIFSLYRCFEMYLIISRQNYEVVEGTCVSVSTKALRKHYTIKIMDDTGAVSALRLGKQAKVRIGFRYRFFFSKGERLSVGSEYLDTALSSNSFLGFEELGEFVAQDKSADESGSANK